MIPKMVNIKITKIGVHYNALASVFGFEIIIRVNVDRSIMHSIKFKKRVKLKYTLKSL